MKVVFVFRSRFAALLGVAGITLYPFVFIDLDEETAISAQVVQHEMVHVEQVRRLGWFAMYGGYVLEYFKLRWKFKLSHFEAYVRLSLEREAFARQTESELLDAYKRERGISA